MKGYVVFLEVRNTDSLIYFALTGTSTGKPACAVFSSWSIPNENCESGTKLYALVLSARASGQQLQCGSREFPVNANVPLLVC